MGVGDHRCRLARPVASVVTINRPDVVSLIERAAEKLTGGNKT